jgi:hypothetical protein
MSRVSLIVGTALGALVVACIVAPAIGAPQPARSASEHIDYRSLSGLGIFTPSAADPKLAALLARSGLNDDDFRFTPAESHRSGSRAITVAVRARSVTASRQAQRNVVDAPDGGTIGLKPIAYNLGVAVGWRHFAVSGDVSRVDLVGQPGSREAADLALSYSSHRFSGRVVATADRPLAGTPKLIADAPSYSLDVGGAYSISRRIDLTAGVRYKSENYRLDQLTDNRRDSQAVYIGTALRF